MTISERKTVAGIPMEQEDIAQHQMRPVTAFDFYGEFGAKRRVSGFIQVITPDVIRLRGENRFSQDHWYANEAINRLKIERRVGQSKNPFIKRKIVWSKE